MVQAVGYGAAQSTAIHVAAASPPRTRRKKILALSLLAALLCACVAVASFGFSSAAVDANELLSKYDCLHATFDYMRLFSLVCARIMIRVHSIAFFSKCDDEFRYAVKQPAPRPLGKVELAVLKIKTVAHDKVPAPLAPPHLHPKLVESFARLHHARFV
jgi:hypothetical protein